MSVCLSGTLHPSCRGYATCRSMSSQGPVACAILRAPPRNVALLLAFISRRAGLRSSCIHALHWFAICCGLSSACRWKGTSPWNGCHMSLVPSTVMCSFHLSVLCSAAILWPDASPSILRFNLHAADPCGSCHCAHVSCSMAVSGQRVDSFHLRSRPFLLV